MSALHGRFIDSEGRPITGDVTAAIGPVYKGNGDPTPIGYKLMVQHRTKLNWKDQDSFIHLTDDEGKRLEYFPSPAVAVEFLKLSGFIEAE